MTHPTRSVQAARPTSRAGARRGRIHRGLIGLALASLLPLALGPTLARANPAMNTSRVFAQPDRTSFELRLWGDEYANGWETQSGHTVLFDSQTKYWVYATRGKEGSLLETPRRVGIDEPADPPHLRPSRESLREQFGKMGRGDPSAVKAAPAWASGNTNVLIILVQFPADAGDPDGAQPAVNASFSAAQAQANLFGATSTGPGNMTDYYDEISFGAINLIGTVVGPYTLAHDKDDYDDGPRNAKDMVAEAIALADPDIDYNDFDNDGDGWVDNVAVMYAGNGPDNGNYTGADPDANSLWPHASSLGGAVAVDGINAQTYYIAPELLNSTPRLRTIGVYAHEFGHKLGLPDLYDTDDAPDDSDGIGHWCLMASGSWTSDVPGVENGEAPSHMSAWCKSVLGWITPTDLTGSNVAQSIPQAETNAFAVQLGSNPGGPDDWPGGSGEYYLIENRQRTGFDVGLDGCGLLVWHIDEALTGNQNQGHTAAVHRLVDLEEADGLDDLDVTGSRGDAGDPFPGSTNNTEWADGTDPHTQLYDGTSTGYRMKVLSSGCDSSMDVTFGNQPPQAVCQNVQVNADDDCLVDVSAAQADNGSSDPDGDPLTFELSPAGPYGLGVTNVTLTVTDDKGESDTCSATITVTDITPPVVTCPDPIEVECSTANGTPKDDPQLGQFFLDVSAVDNCDANPVITNDAPALFPLGDTVVTFTATDDSGNAGTCQVTVTVVDTTPPTIEVGLNRDVLWPPNHKMVEILATIEVEDICDPNPTWVLESIVSDEPDNGRGDGNTVNDIQEADFETADDAFLLRSERQGPGDGRVYTITYRAMDLSGNEAWDVVEVHVPHSQAGSAKAGAGIVAGELDLSEKYLVLIISSASTSISMEIDGGKTPSAGYGFNASQLEASAVYLGNTGLALAASEAQHADVDGDQLKDLIVTFAMNEVESIVEHSTIEDGSVGLLYKAADGKSFVVDDIFTLETVDLDAGLIGSSASTHSRENLSNSRGNQSLPKRTALATLHPNPFNPATAVAFEVMSPGRVRIDVYNLAGQRVRSLVNAPFSVGRHSIVWNGLDDTGSSVASGTYLFVLDGADGQSTRKGLLVK